LNGGFGASIRPNAFGLSACSLFFFFCLFSVSLSIPTKWRLGNTFGFSALSPTTSLYRSLLLTLSLARFHFRLNCGLGSRLSTKCIRLFCNLYLCFFLLVPCSACSLSFSLSLPAVALSISRFHFRLHGSLNAAGFRRNTFGFSAPSPFPPLRRSLRTVSHSLPTEWRLRSVLSKEYIWFLCYLYFSFSLWVSFSSAYYISLSLSPPTERWLCNRLSLLYFLFLPFIVFFRLRRIRF
jgi:hypothetical protein